ncbi:MAG: hypothetical protein GX366_07285 [Epulopiscium sp.]|nr:hypothetical protein [Candidatus Epulonipiscium sp.]
MTRYEKRVLRLRNHVLSHGEKEELAEELHEANLFEKSVEELKEIAKEKGLEGYSRLKKDELIQLLEGE